eukprot:scaffold4205_cov48-Cylindrotheca_fusiformis.AAC.3
MDTEGEECRGDLYAAVRYVKVTREGDPNDFFIGPPLEEPAAFAEPKKRWANSYACRLLYHHDDVWKGVVQFDENGTPLMPVENIYSMHPEYIVIFMLLCAMFRRLRKTKEKTGKFVWTLTSLSDGQDSYTP